MATASARQRASLVGFVAISLCLTVLAACGDDDDPQAAVHAACNASCTSTAGSCNVAATESGCETLCDLGYNLAPACAGTYEAYVHCAGASPLLECHGNQVSVDVGGPACLDELGNYLTCAVGHINACFELPLDDAACVQANMGQHARACIGTPANCTLLTGTVQAGGVGVFCCQ